MNSILSDFEVGYIVESDKVNDCLICYLILHATDQSGEKKLLNVYAKVDLIKETCEFYALNPDNYDLEYVELFLLTLPDEVKEYLKNSILSKIS